MFRKRNPKNTILSVKHCVGSIVKGIIKKGREEIWKKPQAAELDLGYRCVFQNNNP